MIQSRMGKIINLVILYHDLKIIYKIEKYHGFRSKKPTWKNDLTHEIDHDIVNFLIIFAPFWWSRISIKPEEDHDNSNYEFNYL